MCSYMCAVLHMPSLPVGGSKPGRNHPLSSSQVQDIATFHRRLDAPSITEAQADGFVRVGKPLANNVDMWVRMSALDPISHLQLVDSDSEANLLEQQGYTRCAEQFQRANRRGSDGRISARREMFSGVAGPGRAGPGGAGRGAAGSAAGGGGGEGGEELEEHILMCRRDGMPFVFDVGLADGKHTNLYLRSRGFQKVGVFRRRESGYGRRLRRLRGGRDRDMIGTALLAGEDSELT